MAKCPACACEVATPFVLEADAWRWLVCPHCAARLERKNPQLVVPLMSFWLALLALGRVGSSIPRELHASWITTAEASAETGNRIKDQQPIEL